jgi:hypothetical protein
MRRLEGGRSRIYVRRKMEKLIPRGSRAAATPRTALQSSQRNIDVRQEDLVLMATTSAWSPGLLLTRSVEITLHPIRKFLG